MPRRIATYTASDWLRLRPLSQRYKTWLWDRLDRRYASRPADDPQALQALDLQELFKAFPGTEKIQAQLIGPNGQRGAQLDADEPRAAF